MKHTKYAVIAIALTVAIVGVVLGSQKSTQSSERPQSARFEQIRTELAGGALLMDVRTPEEYAAGHIAGAGTLPLQAIQSGAVPGGDTSKKIYVYCRTGHRSAQATILLRKAGYTVEDLGSMDGVVAMGGTVTR